jgi:hypothetical protein
VRLLGDERNQVREGSAEAVQFPNDSGVAGAKRGKDRIEATPGSDAAAYALVCEYTPAPGSSEVVTLQGQVLVNGRDARISDQHAMLWDKIVGHTSY